MKIQKVLRNIATAGIISLTALTLPNKAMAEVHGNIKYIKTTEESNSVGSYVEGNFFYELPGKINGYTFVDLYGKEHGYFGKTSLDKKIVKDISGKTELNNFNEPASEIGFGVKYQIPGLPDNAFANVSLMPFYFDKGEKIEGKTLLQYFAVLNLPRGFELSSFGEWDEEGNWTYGEIEFKKAIDPVGLSYNPALIGLENSTPDLEHRFAITIDF